MHLVVDLSILILLVQLVPTVIAKKYWWQGRQEGIDNIKTKDERLLDSYILDLMYNEDNTYIKNFLFLGNYLLRFVKLDN